MKYVVDDRDRHGNIRRYVKRAGKRKIRLRSEPGTAAFEAEYRAALQINETPTPRSRPAPSRTWPATSYLYVIGADVRPVKIGISVDPKARLKRLRSGNPARLQIQRLFKASGRVVDRVEATALSMASSARLFGEWLDLTADQAADILMAAAAHLDAKIVPLSNPTGIPL